MSLGQSLKLNLSVYSDQDHVKALATISKLEKENKELREKLKFYNRLSRLKK